MLLCGRTERESPSKIEKGKRHMFFIKATAIQLIDDSAYPEIVRCVFTDFHGCTHTFTEKWPKVSNDDFENSFPRECTLGCVLVEKRGEICVVDTSQPWYVESEDEKTVFEIHEDLLLEDDWTEPIEQ